MSNIIKINDNDYEVKKLTPNGIATIANILGRLSVDGRKYLSQNGSKNSTDSFMWGVLAVVTGNDLINFASALIAAPIAFVEENFDLGWIMEAFKIQMELSNINGILTNFTSSYSPNQE